MGVRGLQLDIQACITLLFPLCLGKCCDMGLSFIREVSDSPAAVEYINIMKSELIFKLNGRRIRKSSITTVLDCIYFVPALVLLGPNPQGLASKTVAKQPTAKIACSGVIKS